MKNALTVVLAVLLLWGSPALSLAQNATGLSDAVRAQLRKFRDDLNAADEKSDGAAAEAILRATLKDETLELKRAAAIEIGRRGLAARGLHRDLESLLDSTDSTLRIAAEQGYAKTAGLSERPWNALLAIVLLTVFTALFCLLAATLKRGPALESILIINFVGIIFKGAVTIFPSLLLYGDGVPGFFYIERNLLYPFAIPFLIAATRLMPEAERQRNGRAMALFAVVLSGVFLFSTSWVYGIPDCYRSSEGNWSGDVLLQSTPYTCGAASIVTLSRKLGRRDVTEQEAAYWSHTIPNNGVDDLGAAAALRQIFPDQEVEIRRDVSLETLRTLELPCLAAIKYSFFFDHMVTVLEASPEGFVIGDPLTGRRLYPEAELKERWLNAVILVKKKAG